MPDRLNELSPFYQSLTRAIQVFADRKADCKAKRNAFDKVRREHEEEVEKARLQGFDGGQGPST